GFSAVAASLKQVVTALLVPLAILSGWARLDIGDADEYVGTMEPLASNEHIQADIAAAVTDRVMRELDTGPLQDTVAEFVESAIRSFTTTETFRTGWNAANREAHGAVQRALREGDGNGAVTLNLAPITQQVKDQL
ncbi:membrane protein, partial [Streptomyces sp. NRRL F-6602]